MILNESNFLLYAAKHYENPSCTGMEEFHDDLNRFKYIKRLFTKYQGNGNIKERLILNHIIVLYNLFGDATTEMLFFKIDEQHWKYLKPFLITINRMPEHVVDVKTKRLIPSSDIPLDMHIVDTLRREL